MTELGDLNRFIDESRIVASDTELRSLLSGLASEIGFDRFSLYQRSGTERKGIAVSDYPEEWLERVVERHYYVDDPVYYAARRTAIGFRRSEVAELLSLTRRQRMILAEADRAGLGDWFAVPAHVSSETCGVATFAMRRGREMPLPKLPVAQLAGVFGFEAARRLRRHREVEVRPDPVVLTPRQVDCLLLVARGKTDWEIGRILGLAEDTVGKYLEDARRRYDVSRRSQLVVRALFDDHFSLAEALN